MRAGLAESAVSSMVNHVARYGSTGVESGGFLLAPSGGDVEVVALTGSARGGIGRKADQFIISGTANVVLCEWAEYADLRIVAQFHSHHIGTELSPIDETGGMRVKDFVSIVIPGFAKPETDVSKWGWWSFNGQIWHSRSAFHLVKGQTSTIVFDERGIHGDP